MKQDSNCVKVGLLVVSSLVALLAAGCGGGNVRTRTAASAAGPLDGRSFPISIEAEGGWRQDTMKFADGRLELVECVRRGFDEPAYSSSREGAATAFSAHMTHAPSHDVLDVQGTVRGDEVEGRYEWRLHDGTVLTGRIRGAR